MSEGLKPGWELLVSAVENVATSADTEGSMMVLSLQLLLRETEYLPQEGLRAVYVAIESLFVITAQKIKVFPAPFASFLRGHFTEEQVRVMLEKAGLEIREIKDSTLICLPSYVEEPDLEDDSPEIALAIPFDAVMEVITNDQLLEMARRRGLNLSVGGPKTAYAHTGNPIIA